MAGRHVARDITYANSAQTKGGKTLVRVVENATGRIGLIKRAAGYEDQVAKGADFWGVMVERYGLSLDIVGGSLSNIPREGPLILVANHPYGILDGLVMGHILSQTRGDFRILANSVFKRSSELNKLILPISFDEDDSARRTNVQTIRQSVRYVASGGALGAFPGGTVATGQKPFSPALDPPWPETVATILRASKATCIPIYFHGQNSRFFQISSHLHDTLRLCLFVREFKRRVGSSVSFTVGEPLPPETFQGLRPDEITRIVRRATMQLGGQNATAVGRQYLRGVA